LAEAVGAAAEMPFAEYLRAAVLGPLELAGARLHAHAGSGLAGSPRGLLRPPARPRRPRPRPPGAPPRADPAAVPGPRRRAAPHRPDGPERLGPRLRAARREAAALDRRAQLAADVRPLRGDGHVPLGRPGSRHGARVPDRPAVRPVGARGLAEAVGRRPGRLR